MGEFMAVCEGVRFGVDTGVLIFFVGDFVEGTLSRVVILVWVGLII